MYIPAACPLLLGIAISNHQQPSKEQQMSQFKLYLVAFLSLSKLNNYCLAQFIKNSLSVLIGKYPS